MGKIVVTAGEEYVDIDALASAIAYNDLLKKEGKNSTVVLSGEFNKSITENIKKWNFSYTKKFNFKNADFVIVDISHPEHLARFVEIEKIIELYDHHFGYEQIWKQKPTGKIRIEQVGACATLIWEEFKLRGFAKEISQTSARLITAAIISNTLNFNSSVTNKRDIKAFQDLREIADLPKLWVENYFEDQEKAMFKNPKKEIINDTHIEKFPNSEDMLIIGQVELWDSREFIKKYTDDIKEALGSLGSNDWFLTSPSISEGKNYIYTVSKRVKDLLTKKIKATFRGDVGTTNKLLLRKEIKKIIYNY